MIYSRLNGWVSKMVDEPLMNSSIVTLTLTAYISNDFCHLITIKRRFANKNRCKSLENDKHLSLKIDQLKLITGQLIRLIKTIP